MTDPFHWLLAHPEVAETPHLESLPLDAEVLGIPTLDANFQATEEDVERGLPWLKWGSSARRDKYPGRAVHCFANDHVFSALFKHPDALPNTGAAVAVEANLSTWPGQPLVESLWTIHRKRGLSASWQARGVRLLVDLNVSPSVRPMALLGVPGGWRAYATRKHPDMPWAETHAEYELARGHAGTSDILFVVFGGGVEGKKLCRKYGWTWSQARPPWRAYKAKNDGQGERGGWVGGEGEASLQPEGP